MIGRLSLVAALAIAFASTADAGVSTPGTCGPTVDQTLGALGVPSGDVAGISIVGQIEGNDRAKTEGYRAWVNLSSCTGNLVIEMDRDCRVEQTYTRGACSISGVPGY